MKFSKKARKSTKKQKNKKTKKQKNVRKNNYAKRGGNELAPEQVKQLIGTAIEQRRIGRGLEAYLEKICPSSGYCFALGKSTTIIKEYFNNFVNFEFVKSEENQPPIKKISSGSNGFTMLVEYEKENYKANAVLKFVKGATKDNLVYEALVGLNYINIQLKYFPCFFETYGLFSCVNETFIENLNLRYNHFITDTSSMTENEKINYLQNNIKYIPWLDYWSKLSKINIKKTGVLPKSLEKLAKETCDKNYLKTLLIEYIDNPITLGTFIENNKRNPYSFIIDVIQLMFQIYSVLNTIKNEFTHYDLHYSNVLLYKIPDNKFVEINYIDENNNTITIKTEYIAKIIDLGRSHCPDTKNFAKVLCRSELCYEKDDPEEYNEYDCLGGLTDVGINYFLNNPHNIEDSYYITNRKPNISHDLRLGYVIFRSFFDLRENNIRRNMEEIKENSSQKINYILEEMKNIFKNIVYIDEEYGMGTIEKKESGINKNKINNVEDIYIKLKMLLDTDNFKIENNNKYNDDNNNKMATLRVYLDRSKELEYII
jgi:hypothetical protein